ncbi:hypothetical protein ACFYKX_11440 [Cytobacillus sp. FJAT-54145]|uniref:Uncharacterized protein n=1 Tax=Cytobacillus spartinae TaxID=3299023 RepID=A0ABW6KAL5_9BACI
MRFKHQIWDFYMSCRDSQHLIDYRKEIGRPIEENTVWFGPHELDIPSFTRIYNTVTWLTLFNYPYMNHDSRETPTKPTNEDILEVLNIIHVLGTNLKGYSKRFPKGEHRTSLFRMADKKIKCVAYYRDLVENDFYRDKEISKGEIQ